MKTFRNEHVTIVVEGGVHLLTQQWIGIPTQAHFQEGSLMTLKLGRRHQITRWLIDLSQLRLFNPTDLQWFTHNWLPKAVLYLPQNVRVAVVLNDLNQFSKLGADLMLRASINLNETLASRYFVSDEEARQWLLNHT
jgi:hypothetical protein